MKLRALIAVLLSLACDGPPMDDAGVDPDIDAGRARDAGPLPDAGPPVDAGRVDAGPPATLMMQAETLEEEVTTFESAVAAAPMMDRVDGSIMDLQLTATGIMGLIGENGIQTLALSDATVRALADLQHAGQLLRAIDGATIRLGASSDPEIMAIVRAARDVRGALAGYRDGLRTLYRERLDAGIVDPPMDFPGWSEGHSTYGTDQTAHFVVVGEGRTAAVPSMQIFWNCQLGRMPMSITIFDEETGAMLSSGLPASPYTVPIPFDEVTALRFVIEGPPREVGNYPECYFLLESRRQLRVAPVDLTVNAELDDARADYLLALSFLASADEDIRAIPGVNPTVLEAVERQVTMLNDILSKLLPSGERTAVEDLERIVRLHFYVDPMMLDLIASEQLAGPEFDMVRTHLTSIHDAGLRISEIASRF